MKRKTPKKVHIIGSVGSGKTTLARTLSTKMKIPFYELDNVVWIRNKSGDIRRSEKERDQYFNKIIQSETWIIEGVHHKWVSNSFREADLIIFLDIAFRKRKFRITKRYILQKLGIEKVNYKPSFKIYKKMFKWNAFFENVSKPEIINMLSEYDEKLLILKDNSELDKYL
ncbi:DNA topology modulation protein FlaR [Anaerobacillus sp. CMMVII]|uniref:AAA family ATPase n=1 Tax=Anaerobacillus sp. CMMVII TaxID=2755588 RepID=UPI0021B83ACE|nr:AAA family ATPase [Anaerobacillus sp. CMMVII]MCT8136617.1 DNA topology modulation protein FlaR [Anaerobacillus sp. CMMVII]